MKSFFTFSLLFLITVSVFSQNNNNNNIKRELDSLKIVHSVCNIESKIKSVKVSKDSLSKIQKKLKNQLSDINSYKIGRTKLEKEKQLKEINILIDNNLMAIDENYNYYIALITELKTAKEKVKNLKLKS